MVLFLKPVDGTGALCPAGVRLATPLCHLTPQWFFLVMTLSKMPYSPSSLYHSLPSYDRIGDMIKDIMKPSSNDYRMAREKVRVFHSLHLFCTAFMLGRALMYDDFRCIINRHRLGR